MKHTSLIILFFTTFISFGQVWKPVKNGIQADYYIYQTNKIEEADIVAYEVESELGCTKPGLIFLAPPYYSKGKKVTFVCKKEDADLIVYWTKNKNEVIWKIKK